MLERLNLPFTCCSPDIDESRLAGEDLEDQVLRLAEAKARAVAGRVDPALVIGSDQLADLNGTALGKPGNHANAAIQLRQMSGQRVRFLTSICLFNTSSGRLQLELVPFDVFFRSLTGEEIESYLQKEQPYQCAGSFKSEALGITLVERMSGPDPTALVGLPLLSLTTMLRNENYKLV